MADAPFDLLEPTREATPLIVEVPHAGLNVPPHVLSELMAPARAIARDADLFVDELYQDAPALGATLLLARHSRYVLDLNRAESDIDAQSVASGPSRHSPRGVVWRVTTEGDRALATPLSRDSFEERLRDVYRPYHAMLADLIRRKKERFGVALVLAAHSMPSYDGGPKAALGAWGFGGYAAGTRGPGGYPAGARLRADVVPGTQGRTSCGAKFIEVIEAHARQAALSLAHDDPYRGGFTTQSYGRPQENVHVVQVELSRRLYMDELNLRRRPGRFEATRAWCSELVAKLGRAALA
jgi:N-formylglutamate deformylase